MCITIFTQYAWNKVCGWRRLEAKNWGGQGSVWAVNLFNGWNASRPGWKMSTVTFILHDSVSCQSYRSNSSFSIEMLLMFSYFYAFVSSFHFADTLNFLIPKQLHPSWNYTVMEYWIITLFLTFISLSLNCPVFILFIYTSPGAPDFLVVDHFQFDHWFCCCIQFTS